MTFRIGVVVPTLGRRPEHLKSSLSAIHDESIHIVLVTPERSDVEWVERLGLIHQILRRPHANNDLSASINAGLGRIPVGTEYVTWVNDDDLVTSDSLHAGADIMDRFEQCPFVYGTCTYVDDTGKVLWTNRSGPRIRVLQRFGPNLMPQPGSLIRRSAMNHVGGLDETLTLAFDLDLFLKLQRIGRPHFSAQVNALVRWDRTSLSNAQRAEQIAEGSLARLNHAHPMMVPLLKLIEPLTRRFTMIAPSILLRTPKVRKSGLSSN